MKVLIAEDDPLWRKTLKRNLKKWGYEVVVAEDGDEAWEILQQDDAPRLAILEWLLPGRDGLDVCRRIKRSTRIPFTYVILLTNRDSPEDMIVGLDAGADDYLTKPINPPVLRSRLLAARRIVQMVPPKEWAIPRIEGYDVEHMLGKGAFAQVWKAVQQSTGRSVALKILRVDLATRDVLDRFEREIELMQKLDHPNIAKVYDSHLDRKLGYLAIELITGGMLQSHFEHEKPNAARILFLIGKVCTALDHAHSHGVIHRDLKPSNIMITSEGEPKLVDFGLGMSLFGNDAVSRRSIDESVVGTPLSMSPEQARGENDKIDGRTDIYALGIVLYIMFVRKHPHVVGDKDRKKTMKQIAEGQPRRPSEVVPGFDAELEKIIMKALAKDPGDRFQTAGEFELELRRFMIKRLKKNK